MKVPFSFCVVLLTTLLTGPAQAQTAPAQFVSFREFVQSVRSTDVSEFLARSTAAKVKEPASLGEMRQHILKMYEGVDVSHSYVLGSQTFDCVPVNQQPSVRALGLNNIAEPPNTSLAKGLGDVNQSSTLPKLLQLPADQTTDAFGNTLGCEGRTVPMRRITLEQLSHFKNLHEFFEKGPNGAGHALQPGNGNSVPPAEGLHKYAIARQHVNNLGANTNINLWRPHVYTDVGEIFSLAQSWIVGDSAGPVQTLEVGWQNYPDLYGTQNSVPFIYWTADGYQNTGCYNLTCPGFVQVDNSVAFGAPLAPSSYSVSNGHQNELQVKYYLYAGNWWLNVNGTWVGYYPSSLYRGGQLSRYSNRIDFGSESDGYDVWPAQGSGLFAESGYGYAAYQRSIYYIDLSGNNQLTSLTPYKLSPSCYSITNPTYDSNWGIYFYSGGPGGASCE